jgi:hypothetical protein
MFSWLMKRMIILGEALERLAMLMREATRLPETDRVIPLDVFKLEGDACQELGVVLAMNFGS